MAPALLLLAVFAATRLVPAALSAAWLGTAAVVVVVTLAWAAKNAPPELRALAMRRLRS
jgi:hypothetical protein